MPEIRPGLHTFPSNLNPLRQAENHKSLVFHLIEVRSPNSFLAL